MATARDDKRPIRGQLHAPGEILQTDITWSGNVGTERVTARGITWEREVLWLNGRVVKYTDWCTLSVIVTTNDRRQDNGQIAAINNTAQSTNSGDDATNTRPGIA